MARKHKGSPRRNKKKNKHAQQQPTQWVDDSQLRSSIAQNGQTIVEVASDGNCLFRSLSDQLYEDHGAKHEDVRQQICDYLEAHEDDFRVFLVEGEDATDFESYVEGMREDGEWGGNLELVAAARWYRRNIVVYSMSLSAMTIEHGCKNSSGDDLHVSFHDNDHYNSVHFCSQPRVSVHETDDAIEVIKERSPHSAKAACPCGSGKRYKKCCRARSKHRQSNKLDDEDDDDDDESVEGAFRVLKI